jgi:hypothetical protein
VGRGLGGWRGEAWHYRALWWAVGRSGYDEPEIADLGSAVLLPRTPFKRWRGAGSGWRRRREIPPTEEAREAREAAEKAAGESAAAAQSVATALAAAAEGADEARKTAEAAAGAIAEKIKVKDLKRLPVEALARAAAHKRRLAELEDGKCSGICLCWAWHKPLHEALAVEAATALRPPVRAAVSAQTGGQDCGIAAVAKSEPRCRARGQAGARCRRPAWAIAGEGSREVRVEWLEQPRRRLKQRRPSPARGETERPSVPCGRPHRPPLLSVRRSSRRVGQSEPRIKRWATQTWMVHQVIKGAMSESLFTNWFHRFGLATLCVHIAQGTTNWKIPVV